MKARLFLVLATALLLLAVSGIFLRHLEDISTPAPSLTPAAVAPEADPRPVVRIGVISRFAPNIIYSGYQPIMDHLSRQGTHRYELALSSSYLDAVERLRSGEVLASFLGSWIFSHEDADADLVPLVAPLNAHGRSEFHAVLVAPAGSAVRSVSDLKGLRVAVPSAQSWSGNWLQVRGLEAAGLSVDDVAVIRHFDHHQTVAWKVLRGEYDVGVVKESVAAAFQAQGLREVGRSDPIPGPPLAGTTRGPAAINQEIRRILLALDPGCPEDSTLMAGWSPEFAHGFTTVDRQRYIDTLGNLPKVPR